MEFLKQYVVTILGIIISATIAITIYLKNKKRKELGYKITSYKPIVGKLNKDIKIFYKEENEITDTLHTVTVTFTNIGNEPIKREDFDKSVKIILKKDDSLGEPVVYDVSVDEKKPKDIEVEVYNNKFGEEVGFLPLLLNPKEEFSLNILTTNFSGLELSSRIVGCSIIDIDKRKANQPLYLKFLTNQTVLSLIMAYLFFKFTTSDLFLKFISLLSK